MSEVLLLGEKLAGMTGRPKKVVLVGYWEPAWLLALEIDESCFISDELKKPVSSKAMTRSTIDVGKKCFIQVNGIDVSLL